MPNRTSLVATVVVALASLSTAPAFAAGGYGPGTATGPTNTPGGYTTVVTTVTAPTSGRGLLVPVPNGALGVAVPANTFSRPVLVEITAPNLSNLNAGLASAGLGRYTAVSGAGIKVLNQNGSPVGGTFSKPLTVRFTSWAIGQGEHVVEFLSATRVVELSTVFVGHTATFRISHDPNIAVLKVKH